MTSTTSNARPLSESLPGTWRLLSRIDRTSAGAIVEEPSLGSDPIALLIYDRAGNFAAQFMKRDRSASSLTGGSPPVAARNNTQAQAGYDAYFGTYSADDATGAVTHRLAGSLTAANVGLVLSRTLTVTGDSLVIVLDTSAADGTSVTRTLTWERAG